MYAERYLIVMVTPIIYNFQLDSLQVLQRKYAPVRIVEARAKAPLMCLKITSLKRPINYGNTDRALLLPICRLNQSFFSQFSLFSVRYSKLKKKLRLKKYAGSLHKVISCSEKIGRNAFVRFVVGLMVVMSVSVSVSESPSCKFTFYGNAVVTATNCAMVREFTSCSFIYLRRGSH